jgi:carbon-monoxide dehydrogenase medium subunit
VITVVSQPHDEEPQTVRTRRFDYTRTTSLDEALSALGAGGQVLAGGQSLVQTMKLRQVAPSHLVDINDIEDLRGIRAEGGGLRLGSLTRIAELASAPEVASTYPWLQRAAHLTADVQVRNRATIGGNLCFADPRSNLASTLISLRAEVTVRSGSATRRIAVEDLFRGYRRTVLEADELLTDVHLPDPGPGARGGYRELSRQPNGVPVVNVAVTATADQVTGIGVGGLGQRPLRARLVEQALQGIDRRDPEAVGDAAAWLTKDLAGTEPLTDLHGTAEYRIDVAAVLLRRLVVATTTQGS